MIDIVLRQGVALLGAVCLLVATQAHGDQSTVPADSIPVPATGRIERLAAFPSQFVAARNIDVWLPEGYGQGKRYDVLFMHDGQMLFDARTTWNKQAWNIDAALTNLRRSGAIRDVIVVGIWNNGPLRHAEYFPEKFLPYLPDAVRTRFVSQSLKGTPLADRYLRFLVEELKPAIDARFATLPGRDHTFVMGSSMGGLISLYAISEYPETFGGAGCLSTHWIGGFDTNASLPLAAFNYLQTHLPDPATHRIYMDRGSRELDAKYATAQTFVDDILRERGYTDANWMSRIFEGDGHNEADWAARVQIPLLFLLARH